LKSKKPYSRVERVNKQILDILSDILSKNVDLSYLGFVTFIKVDVAPDFKTANVFFSVLNPKRPEKEVILEFNKKRKAFKKFMGPQLQLRNIPDLRFYLDNSFEHGEKIERLLKDSISKSEKHDS
tara:strand:- start:103 stop:477 length:375 start_codon:yes stop_codon:yes gene_type:complete